MQLVVLCRECDVGGGGLAGRLCFLLYPFKDMGVVALGKLSGKQLNSKACEHQH